MKDPTSVSLFKDKTNIFTANNGHAIHPAFNEGFLWINSLTRSHSLCYSFLLQFLTLENIFRSFFVDVNYFMLAIEFR